MAAVVDTSALYAVLVPGDAHARLARSLLARHRALEVPPAILAETEALIRLRAGPDVARNAIAQFLSTNPNAAVLDADLHPEAMRIWMKHTKLSYEDAHAVAGALHLGCDLLTFDTNQEQAWKMERP